MELMKQVMAILEKMNYNEWPFKIEYDRQHMMYSRVKIYVATQKMMKDIENALKTFHEDLAVISEFVSVETKAIRRGGRIIHYRVLVHRKGDSMMVTNSDNRTAVVFPQEPTKNGDQEHVMMSKVEADKLALGIKHGWELSSTAPALLAMLKKCVNFYFEGETDFQDDVYALIEEAEGGTWNGYEKLPSQDVRVGMEIRTAFGWVKVLHVSRIVARDKEAPYYLFQHKESAPSIKHEKNDLVSVKKGWVTFLPAMDEGRTA